MPRAMPLLLLLLLFLLLSLFLPSTISLPVPAPFSSTREAKKGKAGAMGQKRALSDTRSKKDSPTYLRIWSKKLQGMIN